MPDIHGRPGRPPKHWWKKCVNSPRIRAANRRGRVARGVGKSPEQLCGYIWNHGTTAKHRAKVYRQELRLGNTSVRSRRVRRKKVPLRGVSLHGANGARGATRKYGMISKTIADGLNDMLNFFAKKPRRTRKSSELSYINREASDIRRAVARLQSSARVRPRARHGATRKYGVVSKTIADGLNNALNFFATKPKRRKKTSSHRSKRNRACSPCEKYRMLKAAGY